MRKKPKITKYNARPHTDRHFIIMAVSTKTFCARVTSNHQIKFKINYKLKKKNTFHHFTDFF